MAKGLRSEKTKQKLAFWSEVTGLAVILFAFLSIVCILTGDLLFYTPGLFVRNFYYGLFGFYSYFVLLNVVALGVFLVTGKRLIPKGHRLTVFLIGAAISALFIVLHSFISFKGEATPGEEFSFAYSLPSSGKTTVGGALASLLIYPVSLVLSKVGAAIFYVLLLVFLVIILFRKPISALMSATRGASKDSQPPENKTKKVRPRIFAREPSPEKQGDEEPQKENRAENFFFNERSGFAFRTKREMAEGGKRNYGPFVGEFARKNIADVVRRETYSSASRAPDAEDQARKTLGLDRTVQPPAGGERVSPFEPDRSLKFDNINSSPMEFTRTDPVSRTAETSDYDDLSFGKDVYTIPLKPKRAEEPNAVNEQASPAPTRVRGGLFDGMRQSGDVGADRADRPIRSTLPEAGERNVYAPPIRESAARSVSDTPPVGVRGEGVSDGNYTERATRIVNDVPPVVDRGGSVSGGNYTERVTQVRNIPTNIPIDDAVFPKTEEKATKKGNAADGWLKPASDQPPAFADEYICDEEDDMNEDLKNYEFIPEMPLNYRYNPPRMDMLGEYGLDASAIEAERARQQFCKEKIVYEYKKKGIDVNVVNIVSGSSVTRFDVAIPDEVTLSEALSIKKDLAFRLQTKGDFRMSCIPGTDLIGIEIASEARRTVGMKRVFSSREKKPAFEKGMFFMLGEDVLAKPVYLDLMKMPHLLICGATGTGKSVCLNTLLISLLYRYGPDELRFVIVDPKKVEFKAYEGMPHLVFDEILSYDEKGTSSRAIAVLKWACTEMDKRYDFLSENGYKDISEYNKARDPKKDKKIPYVVLLIDEFADFIMATPACRKDIDFYVARLAQKARAAGISLILATQRPSVDVISGTIKSNISSRICFKTSSGTDSRVAIDDPRAESLLSMGDCYYKTSTDSSLRRAQGAFISNDEIKKVVSYIKEHNKAYFDNEILARIKREATKIGQEPEEDEDLPSPKSQSGDSGGRMLLNPSAADEKTKRAIRIAIHRGTVSASLLRTYLSVGYNKACSMVLWMERMGYITAPLDNQIRRTIITKEKYEELFGEYKEDF